MKAWVFWIALICCGVLALPVLVVCARIASQAAQSTRGRVLE